MMNVEESADVVASIEVTLSDDKHVVEQEV
jgi:hypothetical protein